MIGNRTEKHFKVTILGSGTGVPLKSRRAPGLAVTAGATQLLFDSGSGTAYQIAQAGLKYYDFDHLFYSHYTHPDHINELAELIFANAYFDPPRTRELNIYGPKGIKNFFDRLVSLYPVLRDVKYPIRIHELEKSRIALDDMTVESRPLDHKQSISVGYRVEYEEKALIYSGDTDYCEALIKLAKEGDLLIVECSAPDGFKVEGHLTPSEIGEIALRAGVKKVILTHLYPRCDQVDVVEQVRKKFDGEVIRAEDLMQIEIL
jgi:ribonuclease BN (tRNA processing enzyme)